jgi:excisionase family DNA binding protein
MKPDPDSLRTKAEAARYLGISLRHLSNLLSARAIACVRIGRSVRISPEALKQFRESRTIQAA